MTENIRTGPEGVLTEPASDEPGAESAWQRLVASRAVIPGELLSVAAFPLLFTATDGYENV